MGVQDIKAIILLISFVSFIVFALMRRNQFYLVELSLILIVLGGAAGGYTAFLKSQHVYRDEIGKAVIGGLLLVLWVLGTATWTISKIPSDASSLNRMSMLCLYWTFSGAILAIIAALFQSRNPTVQVLIAAGLPIGAAVFLYLRSRSEKPTSHDD